MRFEADKSLPLIVAKHLQYSQKHRMVNKHLQSHISFIARFVKIFSMDYRYFGDVMKTITYY